MEISYYDVEQTEDLITQIIQDLHELDLSEFALILFNPETLVELKKLLQSITLIVPIGSKKYDPLTKTFRHENLRWLFLDSHGENVASKVYLLIIKDISDYIRSLSEGAYSLNCYGSAIIGNSTFPVASKLPYPGSFLRRIPYKTISDLDIFIVVNYHSPIEYYEVFTAVQERLLAIKFYIPHQIRCGINELTPILTPEMARNYPLPTLAF